MLNLTNRIIVCFALVVFFLCADAICQKSGTDVASDRARAMILVEENRYLDAYPLLDKVARSLPQDTAVWTHYGIAIAARSATLSDPAQRKAERKRAYEALSKARNLGTNNVMALHFLDQMSADGGDEDNFASENVEVEKALREGEALFGRGDYQKAFFAYERAYKLDPKNYEAVLFIGDTFYAQKKYAESEPWFAKAAAIDPDRELAYRFWGDALLYQGKLSEATSRFIDAFIAEPYSRYAWENINKLTEKYGKQFSVRVVVPPGSTAFEGIVVDAAKLSGEDGTDHWSKYDRERELWRTTKFKKEYPGIPYRRTLKEEAAALRIVAESGSMAVKRGDIKKPHHSIVNLLELHEKNLIESYVLLLLSNEDIAKNYSDYRKANRDKLRKFLAEHVFVF